MFKLRNEFTRVSCFIKLKGLMLYETHGQRVIPVFHRVSNHMHVTKLACLGWMITLLIIDDFEKIILIMQQGVR